MQGAPRHSPPPPPPAVVSRWEDHAGSDNDPARADRLNTIVGQVLADRPSFTVVDVGGWLSQRPGGVHNTDDRIDGVHYGGPGADAMAAWLVPQILLRIEEHRVASG